MGGTRSNRIIPWGSLGVQGLPWDGRLWTVRWYCAIIRNAPALSEPGVLVLLSSPRVAAKGGAAAAKTPTLDLRLVTVGLTHIGQVRICTVWHNGLPVTTENLETLDVEIIAATAGWRLCSAIDLRQRLHLAPNDPIDQLLHQSSALELNCSIGRIRRLVIPSIELFSRCFGRSQHVKRVLATLPFDDAQRALLAQDRVQQAPGEWLVTLAMCCFDDDAVFLAHLRHDPAVQRRLRHLCGSFQAAPVRAGEALVVPEVLPWWDGDGILRCRGVVSPADPTTFLVYRVDGMSDPSGPPIQIDRENSNRLADNALDGAEPSGWQRSRDIHQQQTPPTTLVHTQEPSIDFTLQTLHDESFKILGTPRRRTKVEAAIGRHASHTAHSLDQSYDQPSYQRHESLAPFDPPPATLSGAALRSGQYRPAPALIFAPDDIVPANDVIVAMWSALDKFAMVFPALALSAESWTGSGFVASAIPIGLPFVGADVRDAPAWCYLYSRRGNRQPRHAYVARLTNGMHDIFFFEAQRRSDDSGIETEHFRGLAFTLDGSCALDDVVSDLLRQVSEAKGVMAGVTPRAISSSVAYSHRFSYESTLLPTVQRVCDTLRLRRPANDLANVLAPSSGKAINAA